MLSPSPLRAVTPIFFHLSGPADYSSHTGCAIARLESSADLPEDRAYVRILNIVRPVTPFLYAHVDPFAMPDITEGSLLPAFNRTTGKLYDWPFSVQNRAFAALPRNPVKIDEV